MTLLGRLDRIIDDMRGEPFQTAVDAEQPRRTEPATARNQPSPPARQQNDARARVTPSTHQRTGVTLGTGHVADIPRVALVEH